jgi:hypothetical protein
VQKIAGTELKTVREWQSVDRSFFEKDIQAGGEPAVLRGFARDWPLVRHALDSRVTLVDRLKRDGGNATVRAFFADASIGGRYFYNEDFSGFNFERRELSLGALLDRLVALSEESEPDAIYAGAIPLKGELQSLRDAHPNRLLDSGVEQLVSLWIGNRGRTATHWDLPQNIAVVVAGRRTFTLFPPEQLPNLYVGPLDATLAGQPVSLVDLHDPDFERFPRFREALHAARSAVLEPGDAIYIPSMWFHHVESHDALGVLLNYWWRDAAPYMITPLFTLLHGLLTIRDLPDREREIWRRMFDHYLFSGGEHPMAHLPESARGIFQPMTPERVAGLRAHLVRSLGGEPRG